MDININRQSQTPIYKQIVCSIKTMIISNELVPGYKLPSERVLAEELSVHRNTVVKAYGELVSEGLIESSRKKPRGYFVKTNRLDDETKSKQNFFPLEKMIQYNFNDREKMFLDIFGESNTKDYISFGGIIMDKKVNPTEGIANIFRDMFNECDSEDFMGYSQYETERMKRNICNILSSENMYINPRNIQIVSETNQALNYLMTLYLKPGDSIVVEEPIVPDNASIFRNKELKILTVPMEEDGINITALENVIKEYKPKFIYTMPNYHNPTGIVMSLEKRIKMLQIAEKYCIPIIEEDSQRDFRYTCNKIPSLFSLDNKKMVVYIDSFTLSFPYGIKTGYIVGPKELINVLGRLIVVDETFVSNMGQYMLNEYIERGLYSEHIKALGNHYEKKRDLLCSELDKIAYTGIEYIKPHGGLLLWCTIPEDINEKQLFKVAERKGLLIMPGFLFYPNGYQGKGHIRLCFSNVTDKEIVEGVKILEKSLMECKFEEEIYE